MTKRGAQLPQGECIYLKRSEFHTLTVYQDHRLRLLRVDEMAIQSACNLDTPHKLILPYTQSMMGLFLFQPPPKRALVLGLGGGDMVRFLHHHIPQVGITAVDIDREVISVAQKYFMLPTSRAKLVCDDALHFLQSGKAAYDTIFVDLYSAEGTPSVLHSNVFFHHCQNQLSKTGAIAFNILTDDAEEFRKIVMKVRQHFNYLSLCLKVPDHKNIILFGFNNRPKQKDRSYLQKKAQQLSYQYELSFNDFVEELFNTNPLKNGELIL